MNPLRPAKGLFAFLWARTDANNCNTYLIDAGHRILVDPGHRHLFDHVRDQLASLSLSERDVEVVLVTHGHPDHMEGLRAFRSDSALTGFPAGDLSFLRGAGGTAAEDLHPSDWEPDFFLKEGRLRIGEERFDVLHTPGHSPGSCCLYWPARRALFSGDVVFEGGLGRTDLPGGHSDALKESILRLAALDVDILLPGHGNVVQGRDNVRRNFEEIERIWFAYL